MRALWLTIVPVAALAASLPAATPARQPTGKWVVDFANSQCTLAREYGTSDAPMLLVFEPSAMGNRLQIRIVEKGRGGSWATTRGKLLVQPSGKSVDAEIISSQMQSGRLQHSVTFKYDEVPELAAAQSIEIQGRRALQGTFAVPKLEAAMKVLHECRAGLLEEWGISRAMQAKFKTAAEGFEGVGSVFSPDDYPTSSLMRGDQAVVRARVRISSTGDVVACDVVGGTGDARFNQRTCNVVKKRGRFKPARTVDGDPMDSIELVPVTWMIG